jgi:hypothetical protein
MRAAESYDESIAFDNMKNVHLKMFLKLRDIKFKKTLPRSELLNLCEANKEIPKKFPTYTGISYHFVITWYIIPFFNSVVPHTIF